jgi:hypothetical protein
MRKILAIPLLWASAATAQSPVCALGAICFSGKVAAGQEFRHKLTPELEFGLQPGWNIAIVPTRPQGDCREFASVVNPPYRAHRSLYIDMSYGWTAEQEVSTSPREFDFVTNCADYHTESERLNIVLWPYTATKEKADEALAKLGTSPLGKGRLWITGSRITHAGDTAEDKSGRIEWMTFTVEIRLPRR